MELKSKYSYGGEVSQMSMNCSELEDKSSQYAQHNTQSSFDAQTDRYSLATQRVASKAEQLQQYNHLCCIWVGCRGVRINFKTSETRIRRGGYEAGERRAHLPHVFTQRRSDTNWALPPLFFTDPSPPRRSPCSAPLSALLQPHSLFLPPLSPSNSLPTSHTLQSSAPGSMNQWKASVAPGSDQSVSRVDKSRGGGCTSLKDRGATSYVSIDR